MSDDTPTAEQAAERPGFKGTVRIAVSTSPEPATKPEHNRPPTITGRR